MKRIIYSVLFLSFAFLSMANEPLSLSAYREMVLNYSQQLKQAKEQTIASIARQKIDKKGYLPKIDAAATATLDLSDLNSFDSPTGVYRNYTYLGQLKLSQPIYNGAIGSQYKASKIATEMSEWTELLTFENIYYQAEVTYWTVSARQELLDASEEYYAIVKALYDIIAIRFDDGMIGKTDLLMITTRLKEAELQLIGARKGYLLSVQNLNILMGAEPDRSTIVSDSIKIALANPQLLTLETVLHRRPDFINTALDIDLQEQYRKIAISKYNPQMGLSLAGGWGTQSPNFGEKSDFSGLAAVSLNIPLVYWGERRQTNRLNKANIRIKMWEQDRMRDQISLELSSAWTNIVESSREMKLADQNMELAGENLDLLTFTYNEGKIPIVDVLSAQLSWIQAYNSTISAYLNHKIALSDYYRAIGSVENR